MKRLSASLPLLAAATLAGGALTGCTTLETMKGSLSSLTGGKKDPKKEAEKPATAADEFQGLAKDEAAFILACRALAAKGGTVEGREGWLFSAAELRTLGAPRSAATARHKAIVTSLTAYAAKLKKDGVQFILVPVTPKAMACADQLPGEEKLKARRNDTHLQQLYRELAAGGVTVVDPASDMLGSRQAAYPKTDARWSGHAAEEAAGRVYKALKSGPWVKDIVRDKNIASEKGTLTLLGDLADALKTKPAEESLPLLAIGTRDSSGLKPLAAAPGKSPVVVVGDGNALAWHASGIPEAYKGTPKAGFPDQLGSLLGVPVEVRGESSLSWQEAPSRYAPGSSKEVKAVVWCLSADHFLGEPAAAVAAPSAAVNRKPTAPRSTVEDLPVPTPLPGGTGLQIRDPNLEMRRQ